MKIQTIIYPLCMAALLGSCHIYKPYSRPEVDTQGLYRDPVSVNDTLVSDTVNMANLPWEKVFTDPQLQVLIRYVAGKRSSSQPDDFAFILPSFSYPCPPRRSE